ncbi:MAG TPA: aspartate aminotransferase family protein [Rectinemataceae bacterium]|nr:aspartate aminotransferase family protein [Rectinemataceae bacterium]
MSDTNSDFFMNTYKRTGLVFVSGEGALLTAVDGRTYVDFSSGIGVNSLGHNHPRLVAALAAQAGRLIHVSNYYNTPTSLAAARELCEATGFEAVFFANSGAEANEGAIKLARKHGSSKSPDRVKIVTLVNSFHGRTLAALTATGQEKFHKYFGPFPAGFAYVPADDVAALEAAIDEKTAALVIEPIQGEGGVYPLSIEYMKRAQAICRERGALFICDEVQCGMGRSGAMLASTQAGLSPDVVMVAKGLGGGVPIGAILARGEAAKVLGPGDHGSTFGGNPLAGAAARAVLAELGRPGFLESVAKKGEYIMKAIASWKHPLVKSIRGKGLMIGIVTSAQPDTVKHLAMEEGLLVLTAGEDVMRLLPPLVIGDDEMGKGLAMLRRAFDKAAAAS